MLFFGALLVLGVVVGVSLFESVDRALFGTAWHFSDLLSASKQYGFVHVPSLLLGLWFFAVGLLSALLSKVASDFLTGER